MSCQIKRDSNNKIVEVLAPNGKPSKLYDRLSSILNNNDNKDSSIEATNALVDDLFISYLNAFDIKIEQVSDIKNEFGSINSHIDILNKIGYIKEGHYEEIPKVVASFINTMMQSKQEYRELDNYIKNSTDLKFKADRFEYIEQLIFDEINKRRKSNNKVAKLVRKVVNLFLELFYNKINPQQVISDWIDGILNYDLTTVNSINKPKDTRELQTVYFDEALDSDKLGKDIILDFSSVGYLTTGSIALAAQGTVNRPNENLLHDVDFVTPKTETKEGIEKKIEKLNYNYELHNVILTTIKGKKQVCYTYLISKKNENVKSKPSYKKLYNAIKKKYPNFTVEEIEKSIKAFIIQELNTPQLEDTPLNKVVRELSKYYKPVDFFIVDSIEETNNPITIESKYGNFLLQNWKRIFDAKLTLNRVKDMWDYVNFTVDKQFDTRILKNEYIPTIKNLREDFYINTLYNQGHINSLEDPSEVALGLWSKAYTEEAKNLSKDENGEPYADDVLKLNILYSTKTDQKETLTPEQRAVFKQLIRELGYRVEGLNNLRNKPDNINGAVDLIAKVIYADKPEVLPEELSHIFIALVKQTPEYARALKYIKSHPKYQQWYDEYMALYDNDINKVHEEIMGKIVGEEVTVLANEPKRGLLKWLYRLWNKFRLSVKYNTELVAFIDSVSTAMVDQNIPSNVNNIFKTNNKIFSVPAKSINSNLKTMEDIIRVLRTEGAIISKRNIKSKSGFYAEQIADYLQSIETDAGIVRITLKMMSVLGDLDTKLKNQEPINLTGLREVINTYKPILRAVKAIVSQPNEKYNVKLSKAFTDNEIAVIKDRMNILNKAIAEADKSTNEAIPYLTNIIDSLETYYNDKVKENTKSFVNETIDRVAETEELSVQEKEKAAKELEVMWYDTNFFFASFGSLKHAGHSLLKAIYRKMAEINQQVNSYAYNKTKDLLNLAKELGITDFDFMFLKVDNYEIISFPFTSTYQIVDYKGNIVGEYDNMDSAKEAFKKLKVKKVYTHYFNSNVNTHSFEMNKRLFYENLAEKYGVPKDEDQRANWKSENEIRLSDYYDLVNNQVNPRKYMSKEEYKAVMAYIDYKKQIKKWYKENTENLTPNEVETIKKQAAEKLGGETHPRYLQWLSVNQTLGMDGNIYYKGSLVKPAKKYTLKESLTENQLKFLDAVIALKAEEDKKLPYITETNRLPQIRSSLVDAMLSKKNPATADLFEPISVTGYDTEFGENENLQRYDGTEARFVPTHFIQKLEDSNNISTDIIKSMALYIGMAENYKQKSQMLPLFEQVLDAFGNTHLRTKYKSGQGTESSNYKMLRNFFEMQLYGNMVDKAPFELFGKTYSLGKLMQKFNDFIRLSNLGYRLSTMLTNLFSSNTFLAVEKKIQQHFSSSAWDNAIKIFIKNGEYHRAISEFGIANKQNKLNVLNQHLGISGTIENTLENSHLLRGKRIASELLNPYAGYELGEFWVSNMVTLSVMSEYKLYENQFYTITQLEKMGIDHSKLPTYWDTHKVVNGKIATEMDMTDIDLKVAARIKSVLARIDGKLYREDRAAIHKGALTQLAATHRNWLFEGLQNRLKRAGLNYETGLYEEGYYTTAWKIAEKLFFNPYAIANLMRLRSNYNELTPYEQTVVKRIMWQQAYLAATLLVANILNKLADDDLEDEESNWIIQFSAYVMTRTLLELTAFQIGPIVNIRPFTEDGGIGSPVITPGIGITQAKDILQSPVAGMNQYEYIMDLIQINKWFETIDRGPYEGFTKGERALIKLVPGAKGIISDFYGAESANTFLKNQVIQWAY